MNEPFHIHMTGIKGKKVLSLEPRRDFFDRIFMLWNNVIDKQFEADCK